jgi:hypothetical protein
VGSTAELDNFEKRKYFGPDGQCIMVPRSSGPQPQPLTYGNSKISLRTTGGRSAYHRLKSTVLKQSTNGPPHITALPLMTLRNLSVT